MGEDVAHLNAKAIPGRPTYYEIESPPRPQPDFAGVGVQAAPGVGVCWIKGIGSAFQSDDFGMAVRSHADALESTLETKYGKPEPIDSLVPGSLWSESRDWTTGLRHGDRRYGYHWKRPTDAGPEWSPFTEIFVGATAVGLNEYRIDLEYYSSKGPACDLAAKKAAASGF